jgi:molybdate transport system substrate-binding protein
MRRLLCLLWMACLAPALAVAAPVRVYAAASLTDALTEVGAIWARRGQSAPLLVFGGSATLARQIEAGAPADVFVSADATWMDGLAGKGLIDPTSRVDLLGNSLVVIAPRDAPFRLDSALGPGFARAFRGRLCMGEPGVVPAGTYARDALRRTGAWDALEGRVVGTDDVRAALAFVERGACGAGIVYATDARASERIVVVATIPPSLHRPIVYPAAVVRGAGPAARPFLDFLRDSREAAAVFERHGFVRAARPN